MAYWITRIAGLSAGTLASTGLVTPNAAAMTLPQIEPVPTNLALGTSSSAALLISSIADAKGTPNGLEMPPPVDYTFYDDNQEPSNSQVAESASGLAGGQANGSDEKNPDLPAAGTPPDPNLNPVGRDITIDVSISGEGLTATIPLSMTASGDLSVPIADLAGILAKQVSSQTLAALHTRDTGNGNIRLADLAAAGIELAYDPKAVELKLTIASTENRQRDLSLGYRSENDIGTAIQPSPVSGYVTVRTSLDMVEKGADTGLRKPIVSASFSIRALGIVLEDEHVADFNDTSAVLSRIGTRLVYDIPNWDLRVVVGDDAIVPVSFQQGSNFLGFSVSKLYRTFDPQRNIRPTTLDSFTLNRTSDVEILVNGESVRRVSLKPGVYDLTDFPFVSGSNNVRIVAVDSTGRSEIAQFSRFFDLNLLAPGITEFSAAGGVYAEPGLRGPEYGTMKYVFSGFVRRGMSDALTLGVNLQGDKVISQAGAQALLATKLGTLGVDLAASHFRGAGFGTAARVDFQHIDDMAGLGELRSLRFAGEFYSPKFSSAGAQYFNVYPLTWRLSADATIKLDQTKSLTGQADFGQYRNGENVWSTSAQMSFRLNNAASASLGVRYEHGRQQTRGFGAFLTLSWQLGSRSYLTASGESNERRAQLSWSRFGSGRVGSFSTSAQINYLRGNFELNGNASYIANRAELDLGHVVNYDQQTNSIQNSRTTVRAAFSVGMAGGKLALGRPIGDSFAIISKHKSLGTSQLFVDQIDSSFEAKSDGLGPALVSQLSSYSSRSLRAELPDAPLGYDLGSGSFLVRPPYKSGYHLKMGSDFSVLVTGRLVDRDGAPLALKVGKAMLDGRAEVEPRSVFTNAEGRFSAMGLAPGRWRILFPGEDPLVYHIVIPQSTSGHLETDKLEPSK